MSHLVLLDNTVLTNFALVNRADLVLRLWGNAACITSPVLAEYAAGTASGILPSEIWSGLTVVALNKRESALADSLSPKLGAGERACIAVAIHRQGTLASDDLDARRVAQRHHVPTTGTLGILVLCVRRALLSRDEANSLLETMIAAGFHSPLTILDSLLKEG